MSFAETTMSFSVFTLLAVVGAVILGGLVLSVVLLLNEKTRVAGIVLLVIILLGVPVVGAGLAVFAWVGMRGSDRAARIPPPRSVQFEPPVVDELPATDEPAAVENGDHPDPAEQIPAADAPEPDPPDTAPDAPDGEPGGDAQTGRSFPRSTHRRLNT